MAAAVAGGPTILTAGLATATGFLVLLLSPVPMVRGFGALLVRRHRARARLRALRGLRGARPLRGARRRRRRAAGALGGASPLAPEHPRVHAAGEWLADRSWRTLGFALARPRRVLAIGLAVAVVGLALDTQSEVVSDVRELVPQDLQALKDVNVLQEETGVPARST